MRVIRISYPLENRYLRISKRTNPRDCTFCPHLLGISNGRVRLSASNLSWFFHGMAVVQKLIHRRKRLVTTNQWCMYILFWLRPQGLGDVVRWDQRTVIIFVPMYAILPATPVSNLLSL
jgi:hypothetical protein